MTNYDDELTEQERKERELGSELSPPFIDWNKVPLDDMVTFLEDRYMFSSSAEAKCIFELIEFYKRHRNEEIKDDKAGSPGPEGVEVR